MNRRAILTLLALAPLAARAQEPDITGPQPELPKEKLVIVTRDGARHEFNVEMALTPDQQTVGLMFRPTVPPMAACCSTGASRAIRRCGCATRSSPLDMVFINADGTIRSIAENTVPESLAVIDSRGPVRATLELAAGTTARLNIRVGDKVRAADFRQRAADGPCFLAPAAHRFRSAVSGAWRSLVSAPVLGTGGRGFESRRPDQRQREVSCARVSISRRRTRCSPAVPAPMNGRWTSSPSSPRRPDPLMGWIGSADTQAQVRLNFATREEAVAYAEKNGIAYDLELPLERRVKPKAYADNFRYGRIENWTRPSALPPR